MSISDETGSAYVASAFFAVSIIFNRFMKVVSYEVEHNRITQTPTRTDDSCNSLFYSDKTMSEGRGFPKPNTVDNEVVNRLKKIHPEYIRLSKELYGGIVANIPTVCVDVICQREVDNKVLLFYRRDKPAKGLWWPPGGRMLKGESFFDTALRKIKDEMGHGSRLDGQVEALAITGVWNTFFHDSSWDNDRDEGKEGCQTVNISVFCRLKKTDDPLLYEVRAAGEGSEWAVEAYRWVSVEDMLQEGNYDKYVRVNAECAREKGLI